MPFAMDYVMNNITIFFKKANLMAPFHGLGSTASREAVYITFYH